MVSSRPFLTWSLHRDFVWHVSRYHLLVFLEVRTLSGMNHVTNRAWKVLQRSGTVPETLTMIQSFLLQQKLPPKSLGVWLSVGSHVPRLWAWSSSLPGLSLLALPESLRPRHSCLPPSQWIVTLMSTTRHLTAASYCVPVMCPVLVRAFCIPFIYLFKLNN